MEVIVVVTGIGTCAYYYQIKGFLFLGDESKILLIPPHLPPKNKDLLWK
jgi:hypothetical protein